MPTVGETFKQRRIERNVSIEEMAEVTKISVHFLQALEHNEFKKLPRGAFPKMFVRSYARQLGLDDDKLVQMYYEQIAASEAAVEPLPSTPAVSRPIRSHRWIQVVAAFAILASLAVSAFIIHRVQQAGTPEENGATRALSAPPARWTPAEPPPAPPTTSSPTEPAAALSTEEAGTTTPAQPGAPASAKTGFSFKLEARDYCWVRLTWGESEQLDFILKPGESFTRDFDQALTLKLGNAGGVNMFLNGTAAAALGQRGEVITVTLDRDTLSQFLSKSEEP